jgi:hypothetical protein
MGFHLEALRLRSMRSGLAAPRGGSLGRHGRIFGSPSDDGFVVVSGEPREFGEREVELVEAGSELVSGHGWGRHLGSLRAG